jgi:hypothetical protein
VYIRYLRNKIDKGFDQPLILTKWGEGYMLRGTEPTDAVPVTGDDTNSTAEIPVLKSTKKRS